MFSKLKLKIQRNFFDEKEYTYDEYIDIGEQHLDQMARSFEKDMYACINAQTTEQLIIDEDWFPELRIDIFISHLWKDDRLELALVGWLYSTFGLRCMIDSYIWDSIERLTDEYNSLYSNRRRRQNGNEIFDYGCGNRVSNHIVSMLHIAANKMMDKAEAVIFLNTDDDWYIYENRGISRRYLPWIYTEEVMANNMRRKSLASYRVQSWNKSMEGNGVSETTEYVSENELEQWEQECRGEDMYPLDTLYKLLNII